jgi:predicted metal-binding protein
MSHLQGGKGDRCVKLTILPPPYADCLEMPERRISRALKDLGCAGIALACFLSNCKHIRPTCIWVVSETADLFHVYLLVKIFVITLFYIYLYIHPTYILNACYSVLIIVSSDAVNKILLR